MIPEILSGWEEEEEEEEVWEMWVRPWGIIVLPPYRAVPIMFEEVPLEES